jgi:hypothetical protein
MQQVIDGVCPSAVLRDKDIHVRRDAGAEECGDDPPQCGIAHQDERTREATRSEFFTNSAFGVRRLILRRGYAKGQGPDGGVEALADGDQSLQVQSG